MFDHEVLVQACTWGLWGLLAVMALAAYLHRFLSPKLIRQVAGRITRILHPVDWVWLLGAGILPGFLTIATLRLTPWGGNGFGILHVFVRLPFHQKLPLPAVQFFATFLITLIVLVRVIRWRLARRAAFLGFEPSHPAAAMLAIASATAFIPLIGWAQIHDSQRWLIAAAGLLIFPFCWLVFILLRALSSNDRLLQMTTVSRLLVPACAATMTALLLATPYFEAARLLWFHQDTLMRMDPHVPALSRWEYQIAVQAQKEFREALGY